MKKIIMFIIIVVLFSNGLQTILAQKSKSKIFRGESIIEELNLTEVQIEKFRSLRFEQEKEEIEMEAQLKRNRLEIKKQINQENFQKDELLNLIDKSNNIRGEIFKSKVTLWIDVKEILNDDQIEIWKKHFRGMGIGQERMMELRGRRFMKGTDERPFRKDGARIGREFR